MTDISELHVTVPRTARYYLIGTPGPAVRAVWVACHGYAQLAAQFAKPLRDVGGEARLIVVPEALSRFYVAAVMSEHSTAPVGASWMTREDREAEIGDIVTYLDALAERTFELLAPHGVMRGGVMLNVLGFSQGAATAARWVARGAWAVDRLVLWSGDVPADVNPRALAERRDGFGLDIVYGTRDEAISAERVAIQQRALEAHGVRHRVRTFEGGHVLNRELLTSLMNE